MKSLRRTTQFKQDVKRLLKRGRDINKLKWVLDALSSGEELPTYLRDHALIGQYKGVRECHIEPDWLLIYQIDSGTLKLIRTGTQSDLFD